MKECECYDCNVIAYERNRQKETRPSIDGEELSDAEINVIRRWRKGLIG